MPPLVFAGKRRGNYRRKNAHKCPYRTSEGLAKGRDARAMLKKGRKGIPKGAKIQQRGRRKRGGVDSKRKGKKTMGGVVRQAGGVGLGDKK